MTAPAPDITQIISALTGREGAQATSEINAQFGRDVINVVEIKKSIDFTLSVKNGRKP